MDWHDDSTPVWSVEAALPADLAQSHQALACNAELQKIYISGGQFGASCSSPTNVTYVYDIATRTFERGPSLPQRMHGAASGLIDDYLHVFGGNTEMRWNSTYEHFFARVSPVDGRVVGEWQRAAFDVPQGGTHSVMFAVAPFLYYIGPVDIEQAHFANASSLRECNERTGAMLSLQHVRTFSNPCPRAYRCRASYAIAGRNCWEPIWVPPRDVVAPTQLVVDERFLFLFGGRRPTSFFVPGPVLTHGLVNRLDLVTLEWTAFAPLPVPVKGGVAAVLNDRIVVLDFTSWRRRGDTPTPPPKAVLFANLAKWRQTRLPALVACLRSATQARAAAVVLEHDVDYDARRVGVNRAHVVTQRPLAIVSVQALDELQAVVRCAANANVSLCARGGRHGFTGESGCDRGVAVDLTAVRSIEFDDAARSVTVGAGALLGQLVAALIRRNDSSALPLGHCATVGVSGLLLSGGHGFLSRRFGLTSDRLLSAVVVMRDTGDVRRVDADSDMKLLRLARGGGSAGQRFPAVLWSLRFSLVEFDQRRVVRFDTFVQPDAVSALLRRWQQLAPVAPNDLYVETWLDRRFGQQRPILKLAGVFFVDHTRDKQSDKQLMADVRRMLTEYIPRDRLLSHQLRVVSFRDFSLQLAGVQSLAELESGAHGWNLREVKPRSHNRWVSRSFGVNEAAPVRVFDIISRVLAGDVSDEWRREFDIPAVERCYFEFKPLGGVLRDPELSKASAFPHHNALWWVLWSCFFSSDTTRAEEARIVAAMRAVKLRIVREIIASRELSPTTSLFAYDGYGEFGDPQVAGGALLSSYERTADCDAHTSLKQCGRPPLLPPPCGDGRLQNVRCVRQTSGACGWQSYVGECVGDAPVTAIATSIGAAVKPRARVAVVLTGQLLRVEVASKLQHLFTQRNRDAFEMHLLMVLSHSPLRYRKAAQRGQETVSFGTMFNGTFDDLVSTFSETVPVVAGYSYAQRGVAHVQLPLSDELPFVVGSSSHIKSEGAAINMAQFDGLRRAMAFVEHHEQRVRRRFDFVLRVRDDDWFVSDFDLPALERLLGDQYDLATTNCGSWHGINDHTILLRRESPAFRTMQVGQIESVYKGVIAPGNMSNNPEFALWQAAKRMGARVALVASCAIPTLAVRKISGRMCYDWTAARGKSLGFSERGHMPDGCKQWPTAPMADPLQSCQTEDNPHGLLQPPMLKHTNVSVCMRLSN
jgi:FAD/FMN-containing dehydrogenase